MHFQVHVYDNRSDEILLEFNAGSFGKCKPCNCNGWDTVNISLNGGTPIVRIPSSIPSPTNNQQITGAIVGNPIEITSIYNCTQQNCIATFNYLITLGGQSIPIGNNTSNVINFTPTTSGIYTFVITPVCDGNSCAQYRVQIVVN